MFIIFPLSHERMEAQRFPYVTLGIVLLNVFFYIITVLVAPKTQMEHYEHEVELVSYYLYHSYLELPTETYQKLSPGNIQQIDIMKRMQSPDTLGQLNQNPALLNDILQDMQENMYDETEEERQERLARIREQEQKELDQLVKAFEQAYKNSFYIKYGYIPNRGGVLTIFSSIFLHGGFFHLLFNMLFLWLSGCNIEDLWGRIVYPVFYLSGGILATLAHGMMQPESPIPLIGASGAIAAAMGAFMIRMYNTKIYFVYLVFMFRIMRGRFSAPAYIMLPLWLLQQLWGAATAGTSGSGVAFWAHIGGFIFGALVALLFKVTGFEENILAPTIEKKLIVVDEHLATGIEKFQEGDLDGAINDLKVALQHTPDDPNALSELSKAYFKKGDRKLAVREFKRAVNFYMKRGEMDEAVEQYLELSAEMPELMLDPPQQMKIASALEQRAVKEGEKGPDDKEALAKEQALYLHAASAYRKIVAHYQRGGKETLEHPDAIKALSRYGDIHLTYLKQPQEAWKAYQILMRSSQPSPEQKQKIQARIQYAMKMVSEQAKAEKLKQVNKKIEATRAQYDPDHIPAKPKDVTPTIPIQKRLKLVPETDAPAKYDVPSVAPLEANKVLPVEGGLDLKRLSEPPLRFADIYVICIFQLKQEKPKPVSPSKKGKGPKETGLMMSSQEILFADLFMAGESRPYRIASNQIAYPQFFRKLHRSSLDNFRQFIFHIVSQLYSVYVDQGTMNFLQSGKARIFPDQNELALHEKIFWKQLKGAVRFQCEHCGEVYWIDGMKIPAAGAKTQCTKCHKPMFVTRQEKTTS
ncbi:rhomboid family protein [Candidatus Vecturithrix granuli]|uniref:Rhomboid family protein n=1 Tax=Vecturithrix granuli TaxID=1499967 RepID=A0A081C125_VECG1|nr:rhomboid family protein [Candidatus Vecturithrix granuli]